MKNNNFLPYSVRLSNTKAISEVQIIHLVLCSSNLRAVL
jgi:hypothetical protein